MSSRPRIGRCHICGETRPLTFEHIPPEAAFNDHKVLYNDIKAMLEKGVQKTFTGKQSQRGIGRYTLCDECNPFTGREYGSPYVAWCAQGMEILHLTRRSPVIEMPFHILPLHVIKQIVSMFLSVNPPTWRDGNPDLVEFVRWPTRKYLDPKYAIFAFYSISALQRQTGAVVQAKTNEQLQNLGMIAFSEVTFPPFGYVMTVNNPPPDKRLVNITYFANYKYRQYKTVFLKLPVLPIFTYLPGDYRTEKEVEEQTRENERRAKEMANQRLQPTRLPRRQPRG